MFAASVTALYSGGMTWAIAKAVDAFVGLRISEQGEEQGLDLDQHGESGYNF
ncbi:MAG: hypothetical protein ACRDGW_08680 [Actinomycetota bacterium]